MTGVSIDEGSTEFLRFEGIVKVVGDCIEIYESGSQKASRQSMFCRKRSGVLG